MSATKTRSTGSKAVKKVVKKAPAKRAVKAVKPVTPPLPTLTFVALGLDKSGSMQSYSRGAIQATNKLFTTIKDNDTNFNTSVSVIDFGSHVNVAQRDQKPEWLKPVSDWPNFGGTALFEAVEQAIKALEEDQAKKVAEITSQILALPKRAKKADRERLNAQLTAATDASFLVEFITDGEENASTSYGNTGSICTPGAAAKFAKMIQEKLATDRFTFAFMMPPGLVDAFQRLTGIPAGCLQGWTDIEEVEEKTSGSTADYMRARARGQKVVKNFFVADTADIKKKDLKTLPDIRDQVKIWNIEKECNITEFVEEHLGAGNYKRGQGYYQLTKRELVQADKDILFVERSVDPVTGKVVYGKVYENGRDLLGLPAGDVKVVPGDMSSKHVLFVQSKSPNRKLCRGTVLVYKV